MCYICKPQLKVLCPNITSSNVDRRSASYVVKCRVAVCAVWPSAYVMPSAYKANIYSGPGCSFFTQQHYTSPHKIYIFYQHYLKYDRCIVTVGLGLKLGDVRLYLCSLLSFYRYSACHINGGN